jgi:hypothetical protein
MIYEGDYDDDAAASFFLLLIDERSPVKSFPQTHHCIQLQNNLSLSIDWCWHTHDLRAAHIMIMIIFCSIIAASSIISITMLIITLINHPSFVIIINHRSLSSSS